MKKIILTLILIFSIKSFVAQEITWNKEKNIGLIPSKNWNLKSNEKTFSFQLTTGIISSILKGSIDISTASDNNWSLDKLWRIYVTEGFPKSLEKYKKIKEGKSKIDNNESRWIEHLGESNGIKFHGLTAILVKSKKLYIINCTSTTEFYNTVENDFKNMIESLKIK